jgi:iron complex transport system substrate-binding protein
MWRKFFILFLVIALGVGLIGCADEISDTAEETAEATEEVIASEVSEAEEDEPYLVFTDGMNREIVLEEEPMRVISVAPSITETIFAIGSESKLIGRTDYCNYPDAAQRIESIGSLQEVNIEKVSELEPDIVLASTHFKEETLNKIESLGIPVAMIISQESFEGVYSNIETIGKILNEKDEAAVLIDDMKSSVDYVKNNVEGIEKKSVYYVIGYGEYGDYTATGDTFIHEMLEMAGGKNVAEDATGWKFSLEKLVEADPAVVIAEDNPSTIAGIKEANGYKDLSAIKEGNLYGITKGKIELMGPRLADGLVEIAKALHPEVFEE